MKLRPVITVNDQRLAERCAKGHIAIIDDDEDILDAYAALFEQEGYAWATFTHATAYLRDLEAEAACFPGPRCLLLDVRLPDVDGLTLQQALRDKAELPLVLMSGVSTASQVATAFRAGAVDFLIKPVEREDLLAAIAHALALSRERQADGQRRLDLQARIALLTDRERLIARRVAHGALNRDIAQELGIGLRTVKLYRQRALVKLNVETVADLVRIADEIQL